MVEAGSEHILLRAGLLGSPGKGMPCEMFTWTKLVSREILIEESHDIWRHLPLHLGTIDAPRIVT